MKVNHPPHFGVFGHKHCHHHHKKHHSQGHPCEPHQPKWHHHHKEHHKNHHHKGHGHKHPHFKGHHFNHYHRHHHQHPHFSCNFHTFPTPHSYRALPGNPPFQCHAQPQLPPPPPHNRHPSGPPNCRPPTYNMGGLPMPWYRG